MNNLSIERGVWSKVLRRLALIAVCISQAAFAYENEQLLLFPGQADNLSTYTSNLGTMTVNPPGAGGFSVSVPSITWMVTLPASGVTTVITPSSSAIPSKIQFGDQRASTYRYISATCLNPSTMAEEPCNLGDTATFPRTNAPTISYAYITNWDWFGAPSNILRVSTPGAANLNQQSDGGWITLPPYVRSITVTAYGQGNADFSSTSIFMADAPSVSKAFTPSALAPGAQSTLTITLKNPDLGAAVPGVHLIDQFPAPLRLVSATHTCTDGTLGVDTQAGKLELTDATLPVAGCQITATVEWPGDAAGISACASTPTITNQITPPNQFRTALGQLDSAASADLSCSDTSAALVTPVPVNNRFALLLLACAVLGLGVLRRGKA